MPGPDFFRHLGLYVQPGFLSPEEAFEYVRATQQSVAAKARVRTEQSAGDLDESRRKVRLAEVPDDVRRDMREKFRNLKPALERQFDLALIDCENPQFLRYQPGDFYVRHSDSSDQDTAPAYMRERAVSVVLFLNGASKEPSLNSYKGGALKFYGLLKDPAFKACPLPLDGEPGLLVAFPSSVVHEVSAVTEGERFTAVTWFSKRLASHATGSPASGDSS